MLCRVNGVCILVLLVASAEACDLPIGLQSLDSIWNCINTWSWANENAPGQIFSAIDAALDLYPYTDALTASGGPYNISLHLRHQVHVLRSQPLGAPYASVYAPLLSMFASIRDVVTQFRAPSPFDRIVAVRPWWLSQEFNASASGHNGTSAAGPVFRFHLSAAVNLTLYQELFQLSDLSRWNGTIVETINGARPDQFLYAEALRCGPFRDIPASINHILLQPTRGFSLRAAHQFALPSVGSVDQVSTSAGALSLPVAALVLSQPDPRPKAPRMEFSTLNTSVCGDRNLSAPLSAALLRMPLDIFEENTQTDTTWARKVSDYLKAAAASPNRWLVLDLSAGPSSAPLYVSWSPHALCLAEWTMMALVPAWRNSSAHCDFGEGCALGIFDFVKSAFTDHVVTTREIEWSAQSLPVASRDWTSVASGLVQSSLQGWYIPGRTLTRGENLTNTYTSPAMWTGQCGDIFSRLSSYWPAESLTLDKVLILSDGRLFGPASLLANEMKTQARAYVLGYGGIGNASMDIGANQGGTSPFTWPSQPDHRMLLPPLPSSLGALQIAFTEYYAHTLDVPRELRRVDAQFRSTVWPTSAADLNSVYCDALVAIGSPMLPSGLLKRGWAASDNSWKLTPLVLSVSVMACLFVLALIAALVLAIYRRLAFNYQELPLR